MDLDKLAKAIFIMKTAEGRIAGAFKEIRTVLDQELSEINNGLDRTVDYITERLLLGPGDSEFMKLLKSSKETQDAWLEDLRKGLGLDVETLDKMDRGQIRKTEGVESEFQRMLKGRYPPKGPDVTQLVNMNPRDRRKIIAKDIEKHRKKLLGQG